MFQNFPQREIFYKYFSINIDSNKNVVYSAHIFLLIYMFTRNNNNTIEFYGNHDRIFIVWL